MNGLGNEILVLDLRGTGHSMTRADVSAIAASHRSSFEQLMVVHDAEEDGVDARIRIYNADGSEAGACGNGTRCVAWALLEDSLMGRPGDRLTLRSQVGLLQVWRRSASDFTVDMGAPQFDWKDIPLSGPVQDTAKVQLVSGVPAVRELGTAAVVNIGNPHAVFFVERDPAEYDLSQIGASLENHPAFPEGANISLAQVRGPERIVLRVWERGAGLTLACGSGACATLVSAARLGLSSRRAEVDLPGGTLSIAWEEDGHVLMTGPTQLEWEGELDPVLFHHPN